MLVLTLDKFMLLAVGLAALASVPLAIFDAYPIDWTAKRVVIRIYFKNLLEMFIAIIIFMLILLYFGLIVIPEGVML